MTFNGTPVVAVSRSGCRNTVLNITHYINSPKKHLFQNYFTGLDVLAGKQSWGLLTDKAKLPKRSSEKDEVLRVRVGVKEAMLPGCCLLKASNACPPLPGIDYYSPLAEELQNSLM